VTALAGALMPYRAKALYEASPGAVYKLGDIPLVTILGVIGAIAGYLLIGSPSEGFLLLRRPAKASPVAQQRPAPFP
jgi:hypothetical protein